MPTCWARISSISSCTGDASFFPKSPYTIATTFRSHITGSRTNSRTQGLAYFLKESLERFIAALSVIHQSFFEHLPENRRFCNRYLQPVRLGRPHAFFGTHSYGPFAGQFRRTDKERDRAFEHLGNSCEHHQRRIGRVGDLAKRFDVVFQFFHVPVRGIEPVLKTFDIGLEDAEKLDRIRGCTFLS